jgi:NAD(P)-dependent dehydrogenase (short-subunit alcohol dehydrogenase family)
MGAGPPAYQVTETALNALTRTLAGELRGARILVNAVCPGWGATDMGGAGAPRSVEEAPRESFGRRPCPTMVRPVASFAMAIPWRGDRGDLRKGGRAV